jgi:mannitol/fructose-specific phosphotransferase system IIA component (Ntr-type)
MSPSAMVGSNAIVTLADFTGPSLILPRLHRRDVAGVIQELSQVLQREGRVPDLLPFYHAVLNREFLVNTGMEAGMAFPHARLPGLKELSFALGRTGEPLSWGGEAARSIRFVFLMAVPATDSTQYMTLISGLARLAKDSRLVEQLQAAQTAVEIFEVLQRVRLRTSSTRNAPNNSLTR